MAWVFTMMARKSLMVAWIRSLLMAWVFTMMARKSLMVAWIRSLLMAWVFTMMARKSLMVAWIRSLLMAWVFTMMARKSLMVAWIRSLLMAWVFTMMARKSLMVAWIYTVRQMLSMGQTCPNLEFVGRRIRSDQRLHYRRRSRPGRQHARKTRGKTLKWIHHLRVRSQEDEKDQREPHRSAITAMIVMQTNGSRYCAQI